MPFCDISVHSALQPSVFYEFTDPYHPPGKKIVLVNINKDINSEGTPSAPFYFCAQRPGKSHHPPWTVVTVTTLSIVNFASFGH